MDSLRKTLDKAVQLAEIASDWNLSEVEIDGEMVNIYDLRDEFVAAMKVSPKPFLLNPGDRVMCACGDERCYKAIEVGDRQLVAYEDVSDDDAEFVIVDLPQGIGLVRYD